MTILIIIDRCESEREGYCTKRRFKKHQPNGNHKEIEDDYWLSDEDDDDDGEDDRGGPVVY
jgi:hypothetical protein